MKYVSRSLMLLALLGLFIPLVNVVSPPEAAADHCSKGEGTLSGPAIDGEVPSGKVRWRGNAICQPVEFTVEVRNVNLPDGTILAVDACARGTDSNIVGAITLRGGGGQLELSKEDNDSSNDDVPFCDMRSGEDVKVLQGDTIILAGCVSDSTGRIPGAPEC